MSKIPSNLGVKIMKYVNIFNIRLIGNLLRNTKFLNTVRIFLLLLFLYAIIFGFINQTGENIFTTGLFWGLFWPFFMIVSLATFGRVFCMVCPHGFLVRIFTKIGLNKKLPKHFKNPLIGTGAIILLYWFIVYTFPGAFNKPVVTVLFFAFFTIAAAGISFVFSNGAYCKYFCPIGAISAAFSRVGFTWLSTNRSDCVKCKEHDCIFACPYKLNPVKFDDKNSMEECNLCMECAAACKSVEWQVRKPGYSLYGKTPPESNSFEIWVYILITGVITFAMYYTMGLSISNTGIGYFMPWVIIGNHLNSIFHFPNYVDMIGFSGLIMGILTSLFFALGGFYLASWLLDVNFKDFFHTVGYGLAPIMIVGSLSHALPFFFIKDFWAIVNGLHQALFLNIHDIHIKPFAHPKYPWLVFFTIFQYIAGFWSLYLIYSRMKSFNITNGTKFKAAYIAASSTVIIFIFLVLFQEYATIVYPPLHHLKMKMY